MTPSNVDPILAWRSARHTQVDDDPGRVTLGLFNLAARAEQHCFIPISRFVKMNNNHDLVPTMSGHLLGFERHHGEIHFEFEPGGLSVALLDIFSPFFANVHISPQVLTMVHSPAPLT